MQEGLVTKGRFSYEFFGHSRFLKRKATRFLFCANERIVQDRQAGSDPSRNQRI